MRLLSSKPKRSTVLCGETFWSKSKKVACDLSSQQRLQDASMILPSDTVLPMRNGVSRRCSSTTVGKTEDVSAWEGCVCTAFSGTRTDGPTGDGAGAAMTFFKAGASVGACVGACAGACVGARACTGTGAKVLFIYCTALPVRHPKRLSYDGLLYEVPFSRSIMQCHEIAEC